MDLETAVALLDTLGCSSDPIAVSGRPDIECPSDIEHVLGCGRASQIRLTYFKNRRHPRAHGTLLSMVKHRFQLVCSGKD